MKLVDRPSPNHKARRPGVRVDTVLLHHTGSGPRDNSVAWLCNPESMVSAHYVVDRDGTVYRLVDEKRAALHAGLGRLPWEPEVGYDFNHRSVGVEIVNAGDGKEPFTEAQYTALGELVPDIARRLDASMVLCFEKHEEQKLGRAVVVQPGPREHPVWVLGHRTVACDKAGRFGRKNDPADNFDWGRIRAALQPRST